jgi:hypothetical protein
MLGMPMRDLLERPAIGVADLLADPIETWTTVHGSCGAARELRRPQCPSQPDPGWDKRLHETLGVSSPCHEAREFWSYGLMVKLQAKGIRAGPEHSERNVRFELERAEPLRLDTRPFKSLFGIILKRLILLTGDLRRAHKP